MPSRKIQPAFAVAAALALLVAGNSLRSEFDHDTWWHLRIGQTISETGCVPRTDPISRMGTERAVAWQAYSWLYEWALYRAYSNGLLDWFHTTLTATSTAAMFAYLFGRTMGFLAVSAAATGLALTLMPMATERPWHATIAFTALVLGAVQAIREGRPVRKRIWLVPLFALWANLHIQFVFGLLVLGLGVVDPGLGNRRHLLALALGCGLAAFANPYHVLLVPVIWDYATQAAPREIIYELSAPELWRPWSLAALGLGLFAAANLLARRRASVFDWGLLLAGAFFASRMNRDLWFGALAAAAVIRTDPPLVLPARTGIVVVVFAVYFGLRAANVVGFIGEIDSGAANARTFPVGAVAYLRESRPPGAIFNDITWGGYIAWALPEYPVTIDGRTNLYGSAKLAQSWRTWTTRDGWESDPDLAACTVVLARKGRPFTEVLREHPRDWSRIYEDDVAVVFIRK